MSKHTPSTDHPTHLPSNRLGKALLATILVLAAMVLIAASLGRGPQTPGTSQAHGATALADDRVIPEQGTRSQTAQTFVEYLDANLARLVATMTPEASEQQRLTEELHAVYERRDYRAAWLGSGPILRRARALHTLLMKKRVHGLEPALYTTYVEGQDIRRLIADIKALEIERHPALTDQLALETRLTLTLLRFTRDLHGGQVEEVDIPDWHKEPVPVDVVAKVSATMEAEDRKELKRRLEPAHEGYIRLAAQVETYRQIADAGGWPRLPEGDTVEVDDAISIPLYEALVERLQAEGDLAPDAMPAPPTPAAMQSVDTAGGAMSDNAASDNAASDNAMADNGADTRRFDATLSQAVERFQARHGLTVDGKLGDNTRRAMNVPAEERLQQIEANLERWRWLPETLPADRISVNVPSFELRGYRNGQLQVEMKVAVGKPSWATPIFEDEVIYAEVNPYWNIPESIADDEVLPALRQDPSYLENQNMEIVPGWNADPSEAILEDVDWNDLGTYGADYRIRQKPGRGNALGQIKFIFPNPHGVYLHDTPAQRAFQKANRAVSHGCVRVSDPLALADFLLGEPDLEEVEEALDHGGQQRIDLNQPMPVELHYWTAFVDDEGRMNFRRDLYGIDEGVTELLDEAIAAEVPAAYEGLVGS